MNGALGGADAHRSSAKRERYRQAAFRSLLVLRVHFLRGQRHRVDGRIEIDAAIRKAPRSESPESVALDYIEENGIEPVASAPEDLGTLIAQAQQDPEFVAAIKAIARTRETRKSKKSSPKKDND